MITDEQDLYRSSGVVYVTPTRSIHPGYRRDVLVGMVPIFDMWGPWYYIGKSLAHSKP
jgi:hypothetical protein